MEPERFDDVGFEILEVPDTARPRRRRPRPRFVALGVLTCSAVSLVAAAALAVTPAQAPEASRGGPGARAPIEFSAERYPARGAGRHHDCPRLGAEPSTQPAPDRRSIEPNLDLARTALRHDAPRRRGHEPARGRARVLGLRAGTG